MVKKYIQYLFERRYFDMLEAIAKVLLSMGFGQYALILLIISIFIDITPGIKVNPIKAIFKFIGKYFNSSIEKEI
jgi:hypothetical protein